MPLNGQSEQVLALKKCAMVKFELYDQFEQCNGIQESMMELISAKNADPTDPNQWHKLQDAEKAIEEAQQQFHQASINFKQIAQCIKRVVKCMFNNQVSMAKNLLKKGILQRYVKTHALVSSIQDSLQNLANEVNSYADLELYLRQLKQTLKELRDKMSQLKNLQENELQHFNPHKKKIHRQLLQIEGQLETFWQKFKFEIHLGTKKTVNELQLEVTKLVDTFECEITKVKKQLNTRETTKKNNCFMSQQIINLKQKLVSLEIEYASTEEEDFVTFVEAYEGNEVDENDKQTLLEMVREQFYGLCVIYLIFSDAATCLSIQKEQMELAKFPEWQTINEGLKQQRILQDVEYNGNADENENVFIRKKCQDNITKQQQFVWKMQLEKNLL